MSLHILYRPVERVEYVMVEPVDYRVADACQVNLCGAFGSVPHAGADDGDGCVVVPGGCGPGVAADIGGEGSVEPEHAAKAFQFAVVVSEGGLVLSVDILVVF